MKRIFLIAMVLMVLLPIFAICADGSVADLSPRWYLPIAAVISFASVILTKFWKPGADILKVVSSNFISYERVYEAAKLLLSQADKLKPFAEWASGIVATIITKIPMGTPLVQIQDIAATKFTELPLAEQKKLLPLQASIPSAAFVRKAVAKKVIQGLRTVESARGLKA